MLIADRATEKTVQGADRWAWWEWWVDRKSRWVRDPVKQLDEGVFRAIAAGTGLPPIYQQSTFAFHNVKDGADRFLGMSKGGERPFARIYTRLGNPTTEYLERVLFQLEAHHVIEKALAVDEREPTIGALIFGSGMGAISTLLLAVCWRGRRRPRRKHLRLHRQPPARALAKFGVEAVFCDMGDTTAVEKALDRAPERRARLPRVAREPDAGWPTSRRSRGSPSRAGSSSSSTTRSARPTSSSRSGSVRISSSTRSPSTSTATRRRSAARCSGRSAS